MIGLALIKGRLNADDAAHAAQVEVRSQIEQWGEVEDSKSAFYRFLHSTWVARLD